MGVAAVKRPDRGDLSLPVRIRFIRGGCGIRNPLFSRPCAFVSLLSCTAESIGGIRPPSGHRHMRVFGFVFMPISGVRRTPIDHDTIVIGAGPLFETLFSECRTQRNKRATQRNQTFDKLNVVSVFLKSHGIPWLVRSRARRAERSSRRTRLEHPRGRGVGGSGRE